MRKNVAEEWCFSNGKMGKKWKGKKMKGDE
jgi:hypothetical protein